MRLIKSADEIQKMLEQGQYADKAVNIGFDNISLENTETDIIAQIDFAIKREGYEMSFETMVRQAIMQPIRTAFPVPIQNRKQRPPPLWLGLHG